MASALLCLAGRGPPGLAGPAELADRYAAPGTRLPSPGLRFALWRRLRLGRGAAGVDAVLVDVPAAAGQERVGVWRTGGAVRFWRRVTLPQLAHMGRGGVGERPGVGQAQRGARVAQQLGNGAIWADPGAVRSHLRACLPGDRAGGYLGAVLARIGDLGLSGRP